MEYTRTEVLFQKIPNPITLLLIVLILLISCKGKIDFNNLTELLINHKNTSKNFPNSVSGPNALETTVGNIFL